MYLPLGEQTERTNYRDKLLNNNSNYKNRAVVYREKDVHGRYKIELSFAKKNHICVKNLYIYPNNLESIVDILKQKVDVVEKSDMNGGISSLDNVVTNHYHPEFNNNIMENFNRQSFNNSFNDKFNT